MNPDTLLATRLRALRKQRGYALAELAAKSGVSRSSISLIERAQTSATAAVLNKLAAALGVSLASLFAEASDTADASPLLRHAAQPVWQDPASGYLRRQLSPAGSGSPLALTEVCFPPQQQVCFDQPLQSVAVYQQLWMLEGCMHIRQGAQCWELQAGDCLAIAPAPQIVFHNPAATAARYLLALTATPPQTGRP